LPINKPPDVAYVTATGIAFTFGTQINNRDELQDRTDLSIRTLRPPVN
jgi:hypothetical protein